MARFPRRDLVEGELLRIEHPPFDIVVALVDGLPYAIEDACNHAGASMAEGGIQGERIVCPMHGYVFSMKTGALLAPEGLCGPQRTFKVAVEGDEIAIYDEFRLQVLP